MSNMLCQRHQKQTFGFGHLHSLQITKTSPKRPDNTNSNEMAATDAERGHKNAQNNSYQGGIEILLRSPKNQKNQ